MFGLLFAVVHGSGAMKGVLLGLVLMVTVGAGLFVVLAVASKPKQPEAPMVEFDFRGIKLGDRASDELLAKRESTGRSNRVTYGKIDDSTWVVFTLLDDKVECMSFDFGIGASRAMQAYTEKFGVKPLRTGEGKYQWNTKDGPLEISLNDGMMLIDSDRYGAYLLEEYNKDKEKLKSSL